MSVAITTRPPHTKWGFAALYGLAGSLVVGLLVLAFVWPAATATAQHLPVGVSGPADQVDALTSALADRDPSPFTLEVVDSRDAAITAIKERELYGAILLGDNPEVLLSTASSTIAAQALRGVGTQLEEQISTGVQNALVAKLKGIGEALASGQRPDMSQAGDGEIPKVTITDVVPLAETDPTGAGLTAAGFPLVLGGILGGVLISLLVAGAIRRLLAVAVFGVVGGVLVTLVMQTWLGILQGDFVINVLGIGLAMAATSTLLIGLNSLIGPAGIGVGAAITMLIANPISGAALPWQFIPEPWGQVGQWFVPGAGASLIRSLSYFPEAATSSQWLTLGAWTLAGAVLAVAGHFRNQADVPLPAAQLEA